MAANLHACGVSRLNMSTTSERADAVDIPLFAASARPQCYPQMTRSKMHLTREVKTAILVDGLHLEADTNNLARCMEQTAHILFFSLAQTLHLRRN